MPVLCGPYVAWACPGRCGTLCFGAGLLWVLRRPGFASVGRGTAVPPGSVRWVLKAGPPFGAVGVGPLRPAPSFSVPSCAGRASGLLGARYVLLRFGVTRRQAGRIAPLFLEVRLESLNETAGRTPACPGSWLPPSGAPGLLRRGPCSVIWVVNGFGRVSPPHPQGSPLCRGRPATMLELLWLLGPGGSAIGFSPALVCASARAGLC